MHSIIDVLTPLYLYIYYAIVIGSILWNHLWSLIDSRKVIITSEIGVKQWRINLNGDKKMMRTKTVRTSKTDRTIFWYPFYYYSSCYLFFEALYFILLYAMILYCSRLDNLIEDLYEKFSEISLLNIHHICHLFCVFPL